MAAGCALGGSAGFDDIAGSLVRRRNGVGHVWSSMRSSLDPHRTPYGARPALAVDPGRLTFVGGSGLRRRGVLDQVAVVMDAVVVPGAEENPVGEVGAAAAAPGVAGVVGFGRRRAGRTGVGES